MNEFDFNNKLTSLEKEIIKLESRIRGAIVNKNPTTVIQIDQDILEINSLLNQLQQTSVDDSSLYYLEELNILTKEKLLFNQDVLNNLNEKGREKAAELISSPGTKKLMDSILATIHKIESIRMKHRTSAIDLIDDSGKKAQQFSLTLIVIVLICGAALFWYIINTIRRQILLIRKLNISEKKVKESARIKEIFMANMSHEIRTPMNAILGFTHLLQSKNLDDDSREYVQAIEKSGENLLIIINDILDLSKIEAGMLKIEKMPFSIRNLLHSIQLMFFNKAADKNIKLSTNIDEEVPEFLIGDATRLTQILTNLVGNALKFTMEGSVAINIINLGKTKNLINLGITVTDTGIGIAPEKQQQIFERFEQAEHSVIRNYGGTGLGLSIVRDLVILQNGTIELMSETGKGSTFKLSIPLEISADDMIDHSALTQEFSEVPSPEFIGQILVVEDHEINQRLIKHLFKIWGLNYDLAKNGEEALKKLRSKTYSLILMDIQMPVMDGYTATKEIRETLKITTPIIAMTAHALTGEKEKCVEVGMNDYISKPLREKELHHLINQYAQLKKVDSTSPESLSRSENYSFINLQYMKEISAGNREYEKSVTGLFIEAIPEDISAIENAWKELDIQKLRHVAHNMKTTVSIMGLDNALFQYLDALENQEIIESNFKSTFREITRICAEALKEAKHFYSTF
ncbi:MAG: response regulator [Ginsengibacter sp.]